jgi:hypothetical protein
MTPSLLTDEEGFSQIAQIARAFFSSQRRRPSDMLYESTRPKAELNVERGPDDLELRRYAVLLDFPALAGILGS